MIDPNHNSFWRRGPKNTPSTTKAKILLIGSILVGSSGQILMKLGTKELGGISFHGAPAQELISIFTCPYIIAGLLCVGVGMLFWLTVLSRLELSFAYPIVALSYVLILIFDRAFLATNIFAVRFAGIPVRFLGIVCIMAGVILISRTEKRKADV